MTTFRKLGRSTAHREAMFRNLTTDVLAEGRVTTTITQAKETRRLVRKMITLGKRGGLRVRRQTLAYIYDEDVMTRFFEEITPKYADHNGGYTRILKMGPRHEGSVEVAVIELV